jgi:hypothetical protein
MTLEFPVLSAVTMPAAQRAVAPTGGLQLVPLQVGEIHVVALELGYLYVVA